MCRNNINSFIYSDPDNSYLLVAGGTVVFAPYTDEWRSAMQYLNSLYEDGFISPLLLDLSGLAFSELAKRQRFEVPYAEIGVNQQTVHRFIKLFVHHGDCINGIPLNRRPTRCSHCVITTELNALLDLLEEAKQGNMFVIHFGV